MTRYMFNINLFVFVISMAALIRARDSPSILPSTTYICPTHNTLGTALQVNNVNTNPIFCSYPVLAGENPNDLFCTYSKTTGVLVQAHDLLLCPANAVKATGKSKNPNEAHPPLPTRPKNLVRGIPDTGPRKVYLKKRRPSPKVVSC